MANTSASAVNRITLASAQDLGDLQPIDENQSSPGEFTSDKPPISGSGHLQNTSEQTNLPRNSTERVGKFPKVSRSEDRNISISSQDIESSAPQSPLAAPETPKSTNNPPRTIHNRHNAVDADPHASDFLRQSTFGSKNSETFEQTQAWDRKAVLSLDGGGIRGYSALLIIKELMRVVGRLERSKPEGPDSCDGPAESSYHPLHPSPCMTTDDELCDPNNKVQAQVTETSPWLPCHYFDYMAGTSTGGLIGIMLGRLRMNIDDCIQDYENFGSKVFARSRWCHLRSPLWFPREKYNHKVLKEVVQNVVNARVPKVGTFPGGKTFAFDENRCRVVVIAYQEGFAKQAELPYLFRTYKNLRRGATSQEIAIDRNPGPAHDIPIWQVARATSAAPTYFKEVNIEGRKYLDGGFGANNPCEEIYEEVRKMNNNNHACIGTIISVGTGKNNEHRIASSNGVKEILKAGLGKFINYNNFARKWASDSERSHDSMTRIWLRANKSFHYCRFNVDQGLDRMKLDEWKARGRLRIGLGRVIASCRTGELSKKEVILKDSAINEKDLAIHGDAEGQDTSDTDGSRPSSPSSPRIPSCLRPRIRTLETIRKHTEAYLSKPVVQDWIHECAVLLVDGRRARAKANPQRWERACFGAWYQCNIGECPRGEKEYQDRHALEKHMLDKHQDKHSKRDDEAKMKLAKALDSCKIIVH